MTRAQTNKLYRNFTKGLITEAGPLTYPENASIGEDNCVIYRKGNRSRRLGIDYETSATLSSYMTDQADFTASGAKEFVWEGVAKQSGLNFFVHQVGLTVYFYDLSKSPLSSGQKAFTLDLTPYVISGVSVVTAKASQVDMACGKGDLFIVGYNFEPILVTYNTALDTITPTQIHILIRDFLGVDDGLASDQEPSTLSPSHQYNLMNQGWVDPSNAGTGAVATPYHGLFGYQLGSIGTHASTPITTYKTAIGRYPSNSKQWWLGKVTVADDTHKIGDFDPKLLNSVYTGNTRAPRGHFIIDAFQLDRIKVSGVQNIGVQPDQAIKERPMTVAFYSGRVWYAAKGNIYYSQVLDDNRKAGLCFQEADPTAEDISDLIATDGGFVPIPEMQQAMKLHPFGSGVLVFATNGVWFVSGSNAGFSATDIAVTKISGIGTDSPNSIVEDGHFQVFYWSKNGIWVLNHKQGALGALTPIAIGGAFDKTLISETTIQSFYNDEINDNSKFNVKGVYDPATNIIQWLFKSDTVSNNYFYDRALNLDLTLGAFYPWTVSSLATTPNIVGVFVTPTVNATVNATNVTASGQALYVNGDQVVVDTFAVEVKNTFLKYLVAVPTTTNYQYTFGFFNNTNFADWQTFDGVGKPYMSYVESGYELLEDAERKKEIGYLYAYFRQTETGFVSNGSGDFLPVNPSSCLFQVKWDFSNSNVSNRWSTKVEAYKPRYATVDETNLDYDSGYPIAISKNKVRGHGTAIQFRFESNKIGYDFDLQGWAVNYTGNTHP